MSAVGTWHPEYAAALKVLGLLALVEGHPWRALRYADEGLKVCGRCYPERHPYVAGCLITMGAARAKLKASDEARGLLESALGIYEQAYGPDHPFGAITLDKLARLAWDQGDLENALDFGRRAVVAYSATHDDEYLVPFLYQQAERLFAHGDLEEAERLLRRGQALVEAGEDGSWQEAILMALAECLEKQGRADDAARLLADVSG